MRSTERKLSIVGALLGALLFATALNAQESYVKVCGDNFYHRYSIELDDRGNRVHGFKCPNGAFETYTDEDLPEGVVAPLLQQADFNEEE